MTDISIYIRFVFTILQIDLEAETGEEVKNKCQTNNWCPSCSRDLFSSFALHVCVYIHIFVFQSSHVSPADERQTNERTNERLSDRTHVHFHPYTNTSRINFGNYFSFSLFCLPLQHQQQQQRQHQIRSRWKFAKMNLVFFFFFYPCHFNPTST